MGIIMLGLGVCHYQRPTMLHLYTEIEQQMKILTIQTYTLKDRMPLWGWFIPNSHLSLFVLCNVNSAN